VAAPSFRPNSPTTRVFRVLQMALCSEFLGLPTRFERANSLDDEALGAR
jgi:hypothetical protein